jgi:hypothetical protein
MATKSPFFALGSKVLGLTSISILLFTSSVMIGNAQQGEVQVESEGDLEATLNGESFMTGETITISGNVEDPDIESSVSIEIIDPGSEVAVRAHPEITADDTFTFSFVAGEEEDFEIKEPMVRSGNYRVVVTYFERTGDLDIYEVEFDFAYAVIQQPPSPPPSSQPQEVEPRTGGGAAGGAATGIAPEAGTLPSLPPTIFQSNNDSIRVGVPDGWVVEDINNTDPGLRQDEQSYGAGVLVELCPQNQATPQIGGTYVCPDAQEGLDSVSVWRFADLNSRPEFAGVVQRNQSITTTDLVAFYFLYLEQKAGFTNFRLVQNIDTTVNVIDPHTSASISTVPAKYIETAYLDASGTPNEGDIALLVLGNDGNTGYALLPVASMLPAAGQLPPEHQMVFDSFELIAANNTNASNTTTINTSPSSPFQQQRLEQPSQPQLPQPQQEVQSDTGEVISPPEEEEESPPPSDDTGDEGGGGEQSEVGRVFEEGDTSGSVVGEIFDSN